MHKTQTFCLVVLTAIAVGFSLYYLQSVLLPFVIALFIVIGCRPILEFFEKRWKFPRYLSFATTFLVGTLFLVGFAFLVWASINDVSRNSSAYEARLSSIATWVSKNLIKERDDSPDQKQADEKPDDTMPDASNDNPSVANPTQAMKQLTAALSNQLRSLLLSLAGALSTLLSFVVLILIFVFFLLLGHESWTNNQPRLISEIEAQIRKFLVMKTVISLLTGLAFGLVLWLFGVPLAVVFGFLAFLLNYIPNIGPLIATILPVPFLVLNAGMPTYLAVTCFVLISAIQFVSGNVIETRLMGKSFDVSPVVLLLALMLFGLVWGIVGMFLATPIVSIFKIVLQQSDSGKPIAELLAGRWTRQNYI